MTTTYPESQAELDAELARDLAALPPIVCFANDWRTDPTSKHHVMRNFGRHAELLWVEASGMRRPSLASSADLGRLWRKAKKALFGGLGPGGDRVWVLSPPAIPLPGNPLVARINARLYRSAIGRALRTMRATREAPLFWVYTPTVARYLDQLPHSGLVYHCVDRWWEFSDLDQAEMRACHDILCRRADVVFASAQSLLADCTPLARRAMLVPHGVEWEHFAAAALTDGPRPADLPDDGRPVIGFFGLIQDWVDLELIRKVALRLPHCTVALLGRSTIDMTPVTGVPNIRILGQKPYAELPGYCRAFAVGLIPFVLNELTDAVNPIKLREYLSAGLPVVSSALPEVLALGEVDGLATARTHDEFLAAVERLVAAPRSTEDRRAAARRFASEGWTGRSLTMARETRRALGR